MEPLIAIAKSSKLGHQLIIVPLSRRNCGKEESLSKSCTTQGIWMTGTLMSLVIVPLLRLRAFSIFLRLIVALLWSFEAMVLKLERLLQSSHVLMLMPFLREVVDAVFLLTPLHFSFSCCPRPLPFPLGTLSRVSERVRMSILL